MIQEYFTLVTQTHCDIMWIIVFKDLFCLGPVALFKLTN